MREAQSLRYALGPYEFREPRSTAELEALYRLNHRVFAEEIPQHGPSGGRLVDKFDHKNRYFVALRDGRLVGMLAAHDEPPFSAADKLKEPAALEAVRDSCLEVRLLAVEPSLRGGLSSRGSAISCTPTPDAAAVDTC